MLGYEILKTNELKQYPQWYYRRFANVTTVDTHWNITIDQGYSFLLREMVVKYAEEFPLPITVNNLRISFVKIVRAQQLQNQPIINNLYCAPCGAGVTENITPAPVDPLFNIAFNATEKKKSLKLNYLYQYKETISIKLRYSNVAAPRRTDILLKGYYLPNLQIPNMWGVPK